MHIHMTSRFISETNREGVMLSGIGVSIQNLLDDNSVLGHYCGIGRLQRIRCAVTEQMKAVGHCLVCLH